MKIVFEDSSYLEFSVSTDKKIFVTLSAKDGRASNKTIVNSAEITENDFNNLIADVKLNLSK